MKSKALLIFAFVAIFLLGVMTGVSASMRWGREEMDKRAWLSQARRHFDKMAEDLALTKEQRERIRPKIVEAFRAQRKNFGEIRQEMRKMEEGILQELTSEQRARFLEMRKKMEQRWQREGRDGRKEGGPPPPFDGPPPPPAEAR